MSPEYKSRLEELEVLHQYSAHLMRPEGLPRNRVMNTWHLGQATYAFIIAFEATGGALAVLPESRIRSDFKHPAFPTLLSLARVVVEAFYSATYLLADASDDERELRARVWGYAAEKGRLYVVRHAGAEAEQIEQLEQLVADRWQRVLDHPLVDSIPEDHLEQIRKGKTDRVLTKDVVRDLSGVSEPFLLATYSYLSKYAHVTAYAVQQYDQYGEHPEEIPAGMESLLLYFLCYYSLLLRSINAALGVHDVPDRVVTIIEEYSWQAQHFGRDFGDNG